MKSIELEIFEIIGIVFVGFIVGACLVCILRR